MILKNDNINSVEKKFLIVANWKANTPKFNPPDWRMKFEMNGVEVAIAASFPFIDKLPPEVTRAAQNVSMFESGAYTGEVSAEMLKNLNIKYCLVGHSERRKYFGETNEIVQKKIDQLKKNNIIPILCARSLADIVPTDFIMYEPEEAISTDGQYHAETPENINAVLNTFPKNSKFLYGGSVNPQNIKLLIANCPLLIGFVVGHASLDPETFSQICASF